MKSHFLLGTQYLYAGTPTVHSYSLKPTNDHDARTESETDPAMPKDEDIGLAARRFAVHLQRMLMQA